MLNVLFTRSWMPNIQDLVVFTILLGFAFAVSLGSLFIEPVRSRPIKFLIYHLICVGMSAAFAIIMMVQSPMAIILLLCWPFFGINGIAWLLFVSLNGTYESLSWACTMLGQLAGAEKTHTEAKKYDPFFRD